MKSATLWVLFLGVLSICVSLQLHSQTQPNLLNGVPPQGSYNGSNVDTVNLVNGNLTLHIPLPFDYPQRGNLGIKYYLVINAKSWQAQGDPNTMTGQWWPTSICGAGTTGPCGQGPVFVSTASFSMTRIWQQVWPDGQPPTYSATEPDMLLTWDGSTHPLGGIALDTSGYRVVMSGNDGNGVPNIGTIIDRDGTQYSGAFGPGDCTVDNGNGLPGATQTTTCTQHWSLSSITDANGNVLTAPMGVPGIDNVGPSISAHSAVGTESAGCVTGFGTPWVYFFNYPTPNGQISQLKLCFATFPQLATAFSPSGIHQFQDVYSGHPFPGTWRQPVYLTNVIFPDNTQWSISYDNYGEISSIGTPAGATIQYGWGEGRFPRCNIAGNDITTVSRAVTSRTITDANGHVFTWNYQWSPQAGDGTLTHTVIDSSGNDSVHVFTDLSAGQITPVCDFREITTVLYKGSGGSRTILKQVNTAWSYNAGVGVPTDVMTTLFPSQKVSLVHTDYDPSSPTLGLVISTKTYDWGQGACGALLREDDTVYQWQKDSRYLAANLLDLPASKVVISPFASSNTKPNCPVDGAGTLKACMAETDYTYDEPAYLTNYENTVGTLPAGSHVAAPNPVRGNPTTVSSWLNTGGSTISHSNWYDTGGVYQSTDPGGHAITFSYDLAYAGKLRTKTCNAKSQCVSGTYDLNTGLLASFTDANGSYMASGTTQGDPAHTTTYTYDAMRRMTLALSPADPNGDHPHTSFSFPDATTVQQLKTITNSLSDTITRYFDGLGHVRRVDHLVPGADSIIDTTYNGSGQVLTVSNPYFSTSDPTYGITTNQYDGLDRVSQTTKQDGSIGRVQYSVATTIAVNGDCTITTDEAGKLRGACTDALGRLVEVDEPSPSGATPVVNYFARMETDGNFVLYNAASQALWSTGTSGVTNAQTIIMQDDGNLVVYVFKWQAGVYAAPTPGSYPTQACGSVSYLAVGQSINANQCLVSPHGQYILYMAPDGNFYIYDIAHNTAPWGAGTYGHPGAYATMQTDGNFVVYASNGVALWNSGTAGTGAERMELEDDGRIIIFKSAWNSQTSSGQFNWSQLAHPGCDVGTGTGWTGVLGSGSCFVSPNGHFELLLQTDGNLVINDLSATPPATLWSTSTGISPADPGYALRTLYTYDALGNLICVEQHGDSPAGPHGDGTAGTGCSASPSADANSTWRVRRFTYDSLGRLLTAKNPESGTISYAYDNDGNVLQKTSPAPNQTDSATETISYCYDELHRILAKGYSASPNAPQQCLTTLPWFPNPAVVYTYDSGANAKGHLTQMTDQAGTANYSYDVLGRLTTETRSIAGVSKTTSFTYQLDGMVKTLTYPSGRVVTYTPDSAGRLLSAVDGNGVQYVTNATYYASDAEYQRSMPGIYFRTDLNPRLQVSGFYSDNGQTTGFFMNKTYSYGPLHQNNGNVMSITNNKDSNRTQAFTYDPLNRITAGWSSANTGNYSWGENYSVDAWGNLQIAPMSGKAHGGNFTLSGNAQNWPTGLRYDAAGNLLAYGSASYSYDPENRLLSTAGMTYTYDGNGERVLKSQAIGGAAVKSYWSMDGNTLAEADGSGTLTAEYIYFGGKRVARIDLPGNTVHYYLSDHLNSTSIVVSAAGAIEEESDYYPFGTELIVTGPGTNELKFTGKRRDTESQLDYFGARFYSSGLGRLISPDPLMLQKQKLLDPQQWNMYQYARDNPLRFTDPTGKYVCEGNKTQCGVIHAALDNMKSAANKLEKDSKERNILEKSIKAYGKEGEKNGVVVQFKDFKGANESGTTTSGKTTYVQFDLKQMGKDYAAAPSTAAEVTGTVAHEGAIASDQKANGYPQSRAAIHNEEIDGYTADAAVHMGLGIRSFYGLWDPSWDPAQAGALRDAGIQKAADFATEFDCKNNPVCK